VPLHVTNGDCTDVQGIGLADEVLVWFDVLHEGPVPAVADEELRGIRANVLAAGTDDDAEHLLRRFVERDRALADNRDGEFVLWFEADLYDQLQIVQILARLGELEVPAERISLLCIGEYPGINRFAGLGQLGAGQLRELASTIACARLTSGALELASRAWAAYRAPQPSGLEGVIAQRSGDLRFLGEAFDRICREYPSTRDGLSLTERRILAAAERESRADRVFALAAGRETRPFLGDTWAFAVMDRLVRGADPLLLAEGADAGVDATSEVRLTQSGARVLRGALDHVARNGVDRWIGGVHLVGHDVPWRFDEGTERIRATDQPRFSG